MFFSFATKHACVGQTDGQMDITNYDPQCRASIAASCGKSDSVTRLAISTQYGIVHINTLQRNAYMYTSTLYRHYVARCRGAALGSERIVNSVTILFTGSGGSVVNDA